ncbi:MAG: hypothetical protein WC453_04105 [Patescibacteria group bacterium]
MKYTNDNVAVSIAGRGAQAMIARIEEADSHQVRRVALFLTQVNPRERRQVYRALLASKIKEVPFVHLRNDLSAREIDFLEQHFRPRYYNMHVSGFRYLSKWLKIRRKIYLEFGGHSKLLPSFRLDRIGGFCIDLAHYKIGETLHSEAFKYQQARRRQKKLFVCNHLNGYDSKDNACIHQPGRWADFAYLKTLPDFVFGRFIALEMENPIKEQLAWRKKIIRLLAAKFG